MRERPRETGTEIEIENAKKETRDKEKREDREVKVLWSSEWFDNSSRVRISAKSLTTVRSERRQIALLILYK